MTNFEFRNLKIENYPYFYFNFSNPTDYNESFHVKNSNTGSQLNIWYDKFRETVTISIFDPRNSDLNTLKTIINNDTRFNQEKLNDLMYKLSTDYWNKNKLNNT